MKNFNFRRTGYRPPPRPKQPKPGQGSCEHCHDHHALGSIDVVGQRLQLCAFCAGAFRRTGSLPPRPS